MRPDEITIEALARALREGKITRRGFLGRVAGLLGSVVAAEGVLARVVGAQAARRAELVVAQPGDISKLDPHLSTGGFDITITLILYDNLTSRHPDGKLYPSAATEWKLLNPTTWEFKLRPGLKFHNGDPLTSADVKFSIDRTYDPAVKLSLMAAMLAVSCRVALAAERYRLRHGAWPQTSADGRAQPGEDAPGAG